MKLIELTQDRFAVVDNKDFAWLSKWKWYYRRGKDRKTGYAVRNTGRWPHQRTVLMHIAIMKRHKRWKHGRQVDDINTCGCDNRKVNLRLATRSGQRANVGLCSNNTSGVTGVSWYRQRNKWRARIIVNGKQKHLGYFDDFDEAVKERQQAEIKYYGKFRHDPTNVCPLGATGQCPDCAAKLKESQ